MMYYRNGTVLIIVAGVSALLSMMALTFLARVRSDVDDMRAVERQAQARIMLNAACLYILEASRIGWDTQVSGQRQHQETFGWIDVRDGSLGPRVNTGGSSYGTNAAFRASDGSGRPQDPGGEGNANFPIGKPFRFDMHVTKQPPYAILPRAVYNPPVWEAPDQGRPYLRYPDPLPAVNNGSWERSPALPSGSISAAQWDKWVNGDQTPIQETLNLGWFRLVRENTGAIFTVTCGAGGTLGYKSYAEAAADGAAERFYNSPAVFASLAAEEVRLWYRVEWSPATAVIDFNLLREGNEVMLWMATMTYKSGGTQNKFAGQPYAPNMGGTIQWIQRLRTEPDIW